MTGAVALALATVVSVALSAHQPRDVFRARTVVTELAVDVRGADGAPLQGLTAEDFEVLEDGTRQTILNIEARAPIDAPLAVTESAALGSLGMPAVVTNTEVRNARTWALVVDDLRVPGVLRDRIKTCLTTLVQSLPASDMVALVPTSGRRQSGREFTRDRASILTAISQLRFPRELDGVQAPAAMGPRQAPTEPTSVPMGGPGRLDLISADNLFISTLGNVASMLGRAGAPSPTMVVVSQGMRVLLSDDYRRLLESRSAHTLLRRYDEMREALGRVERSGVTLHVIDPIGFDERMERRLNTADRLLGSQAQERARRDDPQIAMRVIASRSGGVYVQGRTEEDVVQQVLAASTPGYLVRYAPSRDTLDEALREILVRVRREGAVVRTRATYARVPDPEFESLRTAKPLGVAVAAVVPSPALGLEVLPSVQRDGGGRPAIRLEIRVTGTDTGTLLAPTDTLEVLALVVDERGRERAKAGGRFPVTMADGVLRPPETILAPVGNGRHHVRIAVRSVALDRTGSVFLDMDVPRH